jgi:hypothetical protein
MSGNGSILWLMFSILQAILAFTGILPSEMAILQTLLGGNSIAFFILFLYFMFRKTPKSLVDETYTKSERTIRVRAEDGKTITVDQPAKSAISEKVVIFMWFAALVVGTLSFL